jgi:hypothetical protein
MFRATVKNSNKAIYVQARQPVVSKGSDIIGGGQNVFREAKLQLQYHGAASCSRATSGIDQSWAPIPSSHGQELVRRTGSLKHPV